MGIARMLAIGAGGLVGVLVVAGTGTYWWASRATDTKLTSTYDVHRADFPIPFPLTDQERDALPKDANADSVALLRAVSRGQHLVESFYVCTECHGANFGGGVMIDDPAMGKVLGPNLTAGAGSRTLKYTAADWDRMVRHGVKPDGTPTAMPAKDFFMMSDRELSDIVAYIRSRPPVDNTVQAVSFGPVGKMLVATGQFVFSADAHPTKHSGAHAAEAPAAVADATYGEHLAQTCTGCHGAKLNGGPIIGGPPDWPPAANLTPAGLAGWTFDDFARALREGKSKNGAALRPPMASMPKFAQQMTETELRALWAYVSSVPAVASEK
jgi:mono/diheme cytochrome c family protein